MASIISKIKFPIKNFTISKNFSTDFDLASINVTSDNPFDLFKIWQKEALKYESNTVFSLANYTKENKINSRFVCLESFKDNTFIFFTDNRTDKCSEFKLNPNVSINFVWRFITDNVQVIRQVRGNGVIQQSPPELSKKLGDRMSLSNKMRWHLCQQNKPISKWNLVQTAYQNLLEEVTSEITENSSDVLIPTHVIAYQIVVDKLEFYHHLVKQNSFFLPDRVLFTKDQNNNWTFKHLMC